MHLSAWANSGMTSRKLTWAHYDKFQSESARILWGCHDPLHLRPKHCRLNRLNRILSLSLGREVSFKHGLVSRFPMTQENDLASYIFIVLSPGKPRYKGSVMRMIWFWTAKISPRFGLFGNPEFNKLMSLGNHAKYIKTQYTAGFHESKRSFW